MLSEKQTAINAQKLIFNKEVSAIYFASTSFSNIPLDANGNPNIYSAQYLASIDVLIGTTTDVNTVYASLAKTNWYAGISQPPVTSNNSTGSYYTNTNSGYTNPSSNFNSFVGNANNIAQQIYSQYGNTGNTFTPSDASFYNNLSSMYSNSLQYSINNMDTNHTYTYTYR